MRLENGKETHKKRNDEKSEFDADACRTADGNIV